MKYFLMLLFTFTTVSFSQGQKVRVTVNGDSIRFLRNGIDIYPPFNIHGSENDPTLIYVIKQKGFVNEGFTFAELSKKATTNAKGKKEYTVQLEKVNMLPVSYQSRMLNVYKVSDRTGRIVYFNFNDPFFTEELTKRLTSFGYKNVANTDLFDQKQKEAELKIVGEIVEYSKNTFGPRFQVSLIINWSVYDVKEDKVVFQCRSTGFSDTDSQFKIEFGYALRNALVGLMSNITFQELARDNNGH